MTEYYRTMIYLSIKEVRNHNCVLFDMIRDLISHRFDEPWFIWPTQSALYTW